jgi:hypothetical protein
VVSVSDTPRRVELDIDVCLSVLTAFEEIGSFKLSRRQLWTGVWSFEKVPGFIGHVRTGNSAALSRKTAIGVTSSG